MKLRELIRIANRSLLRSKIRTFLTIMSIFVGSFTLTMINGISDGLRSFIKTQSEDIEGNKVLFVSKKFPIEEKAQVSFDEPQEYKEEKEEDKQRNVTDPSTLTVSLSKMEDLVKEFPQVKTVTPEYRLVSEYIAMEGTKKYRASLEMVSKGIKQKLEAGKNFDGSNQIILSLSQASAFDENLENLIGKTTMLAYKIENTKELKIIELKIVGIAKKNMLFSNKLFVNSQTAKQIYTDQRSQSPDFNRFRRFIFQLNSDDEKLIEELKNKLDKKGFNAVTFADIQMPAYFATEVLRIGLSLFALIALIAASFGIINTSVIAVMERTKDIGLQRALGMSRAKIFLLFSFESISIGFWGAISGTVFGFGIGVLANLYLAYAYPKSFEEYSLFAFTPLAAALTTLLICIIAFLAGVLPAFRASRLKPIDALRYE